LHRIIRQSNYRKSAWRIASQAFYSCESIKEAYFTGNAPVIVTGAGISKWEAFDWCADGFTIYYLKGTSGWSNPKWEGYPCYPVDEIPEDPGTTEPETMRGDVNGDKKITILDYTILARWLAGWTGYDALVDLEAADLNGDSVVNAKDRMLLARQVVK